MTAFLHPTQSFATILRLRTFTFRRGNALQTAGINTVGEVREAPGCSAIGPARSGKGVCRPSEGNAGMALD
jgi:hypothetical protein